MQLKSEASAPVRQLAAAWLTAKRGWQIVAGLMLLVGMLNPASVVAQDADARTESQQPPGGPDFLSEILPILSSRCYACHGADEHSRQGDLRLDVPPDKLEPGKPHAIVPGNPAGSELIVRILSPDPELRMPPADSGKELTEQEIEQLRQWIAHGAEYAAHWAFVKPVRSPVPEVESDDWSRSTIDRFVLAEQYRRDLHPQRDADAWTLIRRVSLDLTGLPPSVEVAEAFAADPSDANYEILVSRLLQSPRFGEHWARMWLDLARYADTKGYEKDQPREIWRYRDWVIDAFNSDMPFDQFTTEQLAGDLLPDATVDQILATAFHRNTMTNDEGGTDDEEFRISAVRDRVDTTVQVWMGLTMGCARCHSHKYDPLSQREYYQMLAYFNQTEDADRYDDAPRVATPTKEQRSQQTKIEEQLTVLRQQYQSTPVGFSEARREWEAASVASLAWRPAIPRTAVSEHGATLRILPEGSVVASGMLPATDRYRLTLTVPATETRPLTAIRLEALTHPSLPKQGPGRNRSDQNFVLNELTIQLLDAGGQEVGTVPLRAARADFSQDGWDVAHSIDGNPDTGWAISPKQGQPHAAVYEFVQPFVPSEGQQLQVNLLQQYGGNSLLLGHVRISVSSQPAEQLKPELHSAVELAAIPVEQRTPEQEQLLDDAWRRTAPETAEIWKQIEQLQAQLEDLQKSISRTPVMKELPPDKQRVTRIHVRGNFLEPGDEVQPALPAAFAGREQAAEASAEGAPSGDAGTSSSRPGSRMDVARWLTDESNPLTARVMVNRIWARFFGRGIVETEEDFGTQGALPTHPELLDWLALEFQQQHAWSIKKLCREIVLSSTYRQRSAVDSDIQARDPDNRWLSRGARFRLTAEAVRDQALAASGLLSSRIGGPSVMPPQPDGIWRTTYSTLRWETPDNENRWRRGIYTFLRRTSPYPSMITFDAGSREVCMIRRIPTNTPLQALVMMNDPVYLEAAGALALAVIPHRPVGETSSNVASQQAALSAEVREAALEQMVRRVLIRPATAAELDRLADLLQQSTEEYAASPDVARALLQSAGIAEKIHPDDHVQLAAATIVASVVLNLDETIMRP